MDSDGNTWSGFFTACIVLFGGLFLATHTLPSKLHWSKLMPLQSSFNTASKATLPVLFKLTACPASEQTETILNQYHYPHHTVICPGDIRCRLMGEMGRALYGIGPTVSTPFPTMVTMDGNILRGGVDISKYAQNKGYISSNIVFQNGL